MAAGAAGLLGLASTAGAQTSDALIDKLVEKGILNVKEAKDLREETDKDFTRALSAKNGMPEWVTALKFNGDFRGRFEQHTVDNSLFSDRNRLRYRLRFGVTASLLEDFEVGFRLASGDQAGAGTFGGNPLTANTTLADGASRKYIWMDAAYVKWNPIHNADWKWTATFGKMDNPFVVTPMLIDPDYQPEGFALQGVYNLNEHHALKFNGAMFVLDEFNQGASASRDPFMLGGQMILDSKWSPKFETSLSATIFGISNKENLINGSAPNLNQGNTRTAAGAPLYNLTPIQGAAYATYKLDSFPLYAKEFPIKVGGEYMYNPGAPTQNRAYSAGVTFGKAGKKGLWELGYKYQRLEGDAWFEELVDDDNGGFYSSGAVNSGNGAGFFGGTNIKGHQFRLTYNLTDSLNLTFTYYLTGLINEVAAPAGSTSKSDASHMMIDMMWKF